MVLSIRMGYKLFILFILLIVIFFIRFETVFNNNKYINKDVIEGVILEEPEVIGNTQRFTILGVEVVTGRYPEYGYGNKIKMKVSLQGKQDVKIKTISGRYFLYYPKIELIEKDNGNVILSWIYQFRKKVVGIYQKVLPEPEASLMSGIVLGVKTNLPYSFEQSLRNTGTIHVIVASGMNVAFISGFLIYFLNRFINRRKAILLSFVGILFYTAFASFQAPIVRASIMIIISFSAQILGRLSFGVLSLVITVLVMLFINPYYIFDVGFQLSVLSTFGLIILQPDIGKINKLKKLFSIPLFGEGFLTTISVQVMTLPILIFYFGQVSLLSPLVNGFIVWTVPIIMVFGIAIAFVGFIFVPVSQIFAIFAFGFLFYFVEVVNFFGTLNFGLLNVSKPSPFFIVGYYLLLISIILKIKIKNI